MILVSAETKIICIVHLIDTGTVFTPLTPFDFKEEEEEHCSTDKEESITVIPTDTPTFDGKRDDGESSQVDDDEDENGVDATIEAEKSERHETERDDQFAERQAEEHLATMRGHSEEFVLTPIPQTVIDQCRSHTWLCGDIHPEPFHSCVQLTRAYRCRVSRREAGCFDLYAERPCGERAFLMTAKKKKAAATTTYTIFSGGENGGEPNGQGRNAIEIGGMKANLLGTNFTVFRRQRKVDKVKHYHHPHLNALQGLRGKRDHCKPFTNNPVSGSSPRNFIRASCDNLRAQYFGLERASTHRRRGAWNDDGWE